MKSLTAYSTNGFEEHHYVRKDFDSTLGAEKQRINEKLSKMAAKQINKSQKNWKNAEKIRRWRKK